MTRALDINAVVHVDRPGALRAGLASARRRQNGAPLSAIDGRLVAIKANIAVEGWPLTAGIEAYADRVAASDAACVTRLRAAGAVLVGATNMDEGAMGGVADNRWTGRTHNPHRHGFTAGGSSGGSAAAVAAGLCDAALGTDTIGSVRIPASYCGVVGHKPARGAIPLDGVVPLAPSLDTVGVLARDAATCALVGAIAAGGAAPAFPSLSGVVIGILDCRSMVSDPAISDAFAALARAAAESGARLVPIAADALPLTRLQRLLLIVAEVEGAIVHRDRLRARPHGFSPALTGMLAWGAGAGALRYEAALAEMATIATAARRSLAGVDALLSPTTPHTAFAFDTPVPGDQSLFVSLASCLGLPATAFPIGVSPGGLPLSAQVMASDESLCLAVAAHLGFRAPAGQPIGGDHRSRARNADIGRGRAVRHARSLYRERRPRKGNGALITLYTSATPNGHRAAIMLEETGLPYTVHEVDMAGGEHKTAGFLKINATGRIPAIVDDAGDGASLALAETLAIALYLSEKSGKLMPANVKERARAWQWGATVISGFGAATPGLFFAKQLGESEHAKIIAKFYADIQGYLTAMDGDLAERRFLAGDSFSFADVLAIPAIVLSLPRFGVDLEPFAAVRRWRDEVVARPAVARGFAVPH